MLSTIKEACLTWLPAASDYLLGQGGCREGEQPHLTLLGPASPAGPGLAKTSSATPANVTSETQIKVGLIIHSVVF